MMTDIVIVNWNSGLFLRKCVESILLSKNKQLVDKIFIIDNNSSDDSLNILSDDKIVLIKNPDNKGFSKACNQGFHICSAPYTLLLNPDAQLLDDTLDKCIGFMQANEHTDILGCALLDDNGKRSVSCARFPTPITFLNDALGLSRLAPSVFTPAILMTDWDHASTRKVDQVMGAFMFMPTAIFQKYGYFDERFFVYYEELDFSKRVTDAGGTIMYNPEIVAIHSGGGTTNNVKAFRTFLNLRSRLQYAKKHFSAIGYGILWIATFVIEPITRSVLLVASGKAKEWPQLFSAYRMLIKKS